MSTIKLQNGETTKTETNYLKALFTVGGIAPLITIVLYLSEFIFIPWDKYPTTTQEWFQLFQKSKLLGLFYLNALDIISITLLGLMFLAIYYKNKENNKSSITIATFFAFLGVITFIVPRTEMLSMLHLSDKYAAASTEVERILLLSAGETLSALGTPTPQTTGFLFMSISVLIYSMVMLKSEGVQKINAFVGIGASLTTILGFFSVFIIPVIATPLMVISGIFWIPWWLIVGLNMILSGRQA